MIDVRNVRLRRPGDKALRFFDEDSQSFVDTSLPDPVLFEALNPEIKVGFYVGDSTHRNLRWHRRWIWLDRYNSIQKEAAQWAKR